MFFDPATILNGTGREFIAQQETYLCLRYESGEQWRCHRHRAKNLIVARRGGGFGRNRMHQSRCTQDASGIE